jgi:hypothetical protein
MSLIKKYYYDKCLTPTEEDLIEYELYCYYQDMVDKYGKDNILDHFTDLMEGE